MATRREVDTAMWLHNKLSSDDMWSGTNIWSMLTPDVLRNIQDCFHTLDSQVKIKLLMSFLYIPRRTAQEMSSELNDILEIGSADSDDWVRILSEILRNYPETGSLNVDLENVSPVFAAIVQDIRQTMNNSKHGRGLLPMECPYLNRAALHATIGAQPAPAKHFTLRRKPKSAALKAELFQKATESSSGIKRSHSLLAGSTNTGNLKRSDSTSKSPVKPTHLARVHSKTAPSAGASALRGLSAASLKQQNRTAKLLDINEQPTGGGVREAKRRKKMTAEIEQIFEEDRKKKELAKAQETSTPEYAIGLTTPSEVAQPAANTAQTPPVTPSYASMAGLNTHARLNSATKPDATSQDNPLTASSANFSQELQMHIDRERENLRTRRLSTAVPGQPSGPPSTSFKSVSIQPSSSSSQPSLPARRPTLPTQPVIPTPPKRDLKLTRDQMLAAQEMFRDANKVTKPEKALILGFMAGARENPFPDQGAVITVKLSEHTEISSAMNTPQTQLVEMLFEMNYETGHWRRLKRTRVVARQQAVEQASQ